MFFVFLGVFYWVFLIGSQFLPVYGVLYVAVICCRLLLSPTGTVEIHSSPAADTSNAGGFWPPKVG